MFHFKCLENQDISTFFVVENLRKGGIVRVFALDHVVNVRVFALDHVVNVVIVVL